MTAVTAQYRDAASWLDFTETKDIVLAEFQASKGCETMTTQKTRTVQGQIMISELLFHLKL